MERGRLRVYLGAAPGVGKTHAMLDEAHRRVGRGTDVVVGYVESHGRERTDALLEGLEVLPRALVDYKGVVHEELDLDAVLQRRPAVVLVDELAHTNVPGSRHAKRWQDVQTLLDAGIEVVTTVNIQHLESLNDVTESITGVRQRETVPDAVVRAADQIELVDMSPQALRRRMAHGNIYAPEKVDAALANYFREGNLTALRELALLWLADRVDEGLETYRERHEIDSTWATRERVVLPLSGGPESDTLLRRAARIAARRSGGTWSALYVTRDDGLSGVAPERLAELRTKTEQLGGTFHTVVGDDTAAAILTFARAENASQIVLGASRRNRLSTLLRPGVGERVIAGSDEIDVHIVSHAFARRSSPEAFGEIDHLGARRRRLGYLFAVVAPSVVSYLLWRTGEFHGLPAESMLLMAVVVATAIIGGLWPALLSALLSAVLLNYLFTEPRYNLGIYQAGDIVAIALFLAVGTAVAVVVDRAAQRTAQARAARAEADALTVLAHSLLNSEDDLAGLLGSVCEVFGARGASVVRVDERGEHVIAHAGTPPNDLSTATLTSTIEDDLVLAVDGPDLPANRQSLLNAYTAYAKVIADRRQAARADFERARLAEADRTRTALLAAVSHDLRSPLAAVKAASDSLRSTEIDWSPQDEADLLETIGESTDRLTALVANLLDMSRIHAGAVNATSVEVSLAAAVRRAVAPLPGSDRISVDVDPRAVALADPGLLDRVVANIAENALKYTPSDVPIRVDAARADDRVVLRIADGGPGVTDHERIFAPFQRLGDVPRADGVGLGLAVARGFVEAMDGTIRTEDTPGGGLTFVLDLPAPEEDA